MGSMKIRNIDIDVDFMDELEPYVGHWGEYRIRDNKLQACSPFRHERRPSFAVNLENGSWIDSGAVDDSLKKGHFTHLLSFLREETWHDTEDYLLSKYSTLVIETDGLELTYNLVPTETYRTFQRHELEPYMWRVNYLTKRGISEKVQRAFKIGYDKERKAVMIPWFDKNGNIINLKFRSVEHKRFWYHPEGQRIKQHIYGLNFVYQYGCREVYLTESETDALYLWSIGVPAIAVGGANLSKRQRELLINSPIDTLIIATDNDSVGRLFADQLTAQLLPFMSVKRLAMPEKYKDVNEIPAQELTTIVQENVEKRSISLKLQCH